MEKLLISGVTKKSGVALIRVAGVPDSAAAFGLLGLLSDADINLDIILQSSGADGVVEIAFTLEKENAQRAVFLIKENAGAGRLTVTCDPEVSKVSVVGTGLQSHRGVARAMFGALSETGVNVLMISSSELRISVVVKQEEADRTVRALHRVFIHA